jgi:hypothetical protein
VIGGFGEVEFAFGRFRQLFDQDFTCNPAMPINTQCPQGPDGTQFFSCIGNRCSICFNSCINEGYDECGAGFTCGSCGAQTNSCLLSQVDESCEGDASKIPGAVGPVDCANPAGDSTCIGYVGGYRNGNGNTCVNGNAEILVSFPATPFDDNYQSIRSYINNTETSTTDRELRAVGPTPLAGSLQSVRTYLAAGLDGSARRCSRISPIRRSA